ncbi:MAG: cystathionine beta-lyase [Alphaproteobacteria bacterium]|nr:cystathionine beta-lyase [Alphaproteobacteria bacterium]
MKDDTKITHSGRHPFDHHGAVNPPVYHASTILFPTMKEYAERGDTAKVRYGRRGTPTTFALEDALTALEGDAAAGTAIVPSGLAAITMSLMALVQTGDHILITDNSYGPTRNFSNGTLARFGVEAEYYDPGIGAGIEQLIRPNTRLIWLESPGSQTFEMQDVPAIVEVAKAKGVKTLIDNTWSGGYFYKPLAQGVDVSVQAGTKYIVAHSDVMLGSITSNEATHEQIYSSAQSFGACSGPDDIYLALRGLRTMGVRMPRHHESGLAIARWLQERPEVIRVMHPGLPQDPGHELWKRDFSGASGLFGFVVDSTNSDKAAAMLDGLKFYGMGSSWGGFESLLIPASPEKNRTATEWNPGGFTMRIHVGLEDIDDLIADLDAGFDRYNKAG